MEDKYLTVTQLTKYIKFKIDNDPHLVNVFLKGEISYLGITESIEYAMQDVPKIDNPSLEDIMNTDKLSRELVYKFRK